MIRVTVELLSARDGRREVLGTMLISNTADGTDDLRNYSVEVMRKGTLNAVQRRGRVMAFPSKAYNIWRLVSRAVRSAFPEEK